jgi:hypothetical protein
LIVVESVDELIAKLNNPSGEGEEAKFELIGRGVDVVPALAGRLGNLERFGKLTAIEAFEALQDARACPALLGLLADEDETVVEWSARALGALRCQDSVEPLQRVLSRMIADHVPPDWTGPAQVRAALADLGARWPVVPRVTTDLQLRRDDTDMWLCRSSDLATVLEDLAEHGQVVLGFTLWRIGDDGHLYWTQHQHEDWSFDWSARWTDNVAAARGAARRDLAAMAPAADLLAHVAWIDEVDVTLNPLSGSAANEPRR